MGSKTFNVVLDCGCMIAEDTGTPEEPNGDAGLSPCRYTEIDMNDPKEVEHKKLCDKCWNEYWINEYLEENKIDIKSIWNVRQNHPELVVQDCTIEFSLTSHKQSVLRAILLKRGVNKWFYARTKMIDLKHEVKDMLKQETDPIIKKKLNYINEKLQNIAKTPRWVEWGTYVHSKMVNNEKEIKIKGRHC